MITAATIRHVTCQYCKKSLIGSFLFIYNHEQICKTVTNGKTVTPVRSSTSKNIQSNSMQGKERVIKSSRF